MNESIRSSFKESIITKQKILDDDLTKSIFRMSEAAAKEIENGNKILICGNGGSAADSQHLAAELLVRLKADRNRKGLPAISLSSDISTLTACANDFGYEKVFERTLESLGNKNDILLAITTSGNSKNVILAMEKAREMGIQVFAFLGSGGGNALKYCDEVFLVPSNDTARIQESHITAGHALMESIENILFDRGYL